MSYLEFNTKKNMFAYTQTNVPAAKRVIATLLALALVAWSFGHITFANAANVTNASDLLSDSAPGADSNHTVTFGTPTGILEGETMTVEFPAAFTGITAISATDVEVLVDGSTDTDWTFTNNDPTLTFERDAAAGDVPADSEIEIRIGTNATGGVNQIANPSTTDSYEIAIAGTMADVGATRVVIIDTVELTASVETVFEFTVVGKAAGTGVNGTSTTLTSSSTSIPFGVLEANKIETLAQDLLVETNAMNGFVVTVESDGFFESSTGAIIDLFRDGTISATPIAWESPDNDVNDRTTWGHWGLTSEDDDTDGQRTTDFQSNQFVGVSTSPIAIFGHGGPADGATAGIGSTTVGYQIEITPLQEAGNDYSTTLTYIATPTF